MPILRNIPWDEVDIETFSVEFAHTDRFELKAFMESKGYRVYKEIDVDYLFVKDKKKKKL